MRQEIAVPSTYHQERLDKTAPFWPDSGIVYAAQLRRKHFATNSDGQLEPTTLQVDYLNSLRLPIDINQLYTPEGHIVPASTEEFDLREQSLEGIMWYFLGTSESHMKVIDAAVAGPKKKELKNSHNYHHARRVSRFGVPLLRSLQELTHITEEEAQAGVAALTQHDIANPEGRVDHSCHGVRKVRRLYPNLVMTDHQAMVFDHTVLLHDGDDVVNLLKGLVNVSVDKAVEYLSQFGAVPMVLILADKADIGISRLPQGKGVPKLDYHNIHRMLNLYWEAQYLGMDKNLETLELRLAYGRNITHEEAILIPGYVKQKHGIVERKAPRMMKDGHGRVDEEGYEKLVNGYWSEYYPRTMLAVMAAFAMNPLLQEMNIAMYNTHTNNPDDPNNMFTFRRGTLAKDMYDVYKEFVPEDKKSKSEYAHYASYIKYEKSS